MLKKSKKIIAMILIIAFVFSTYSVAFANVITEGTNAPETTQVESSIDRIIVKDLETKILLEDGRDQTGKTPIVVEEFPTSIQSELDAQAQEIDEQDLSDENGVEPRFVIALPLAEWLGSAAYAGLLALGLILSGDIIGEMVLAQKVENEIKNQNQRYFMTSRDGGNVYVGASVTESTAKSILSASMKLGSNNYTDPKSCHNLGNVLCKNGSDANKIATAVSDTPYAPKYEEAHGSGDTTLDGYYPHYHPFLTKWGTQAHIAHVWFLL